MNIIVFGDSITQGFDDTEYGGWVNRLFMAVGTRKPGQLHGDFHSVFNLGISGDTTEGVLKRIETELTARADGDNVIIFDIGGNDSVRNISTGECQVTLEKFISNYQKLISLAKEIGRVVCIGIHDSDESRLNPFPHYDGHASLDEDSILYDKAINELADKNSALYISMKNLLNKDFMNLTYDGDHPSPEGHRLIFERIFSELKKEKILV